MQIVVVQLVQECVPPILTLADGLFEVLLELRLINQFSMETPFESPIRNHEHVHNAILTEIIILSSQAFLDALSLLIFWQTHEKEREQHADQCATARS